MTGPIDTTTSASSDGSAPPSAAGLDEVLGQTSELRRLAHTDSVSVLELPGTGLASFVSRALELPGARLADLFATRSRAGELRLRTILAMDADSRYLVVESPLAGDTMPWLSRISPAAFVEECELYEQFGLQPPAGHLLNRLAVAPASSPEHPRLGEHWRPGRDTHMPFTVGGHAFEFPVGPVRGEGMESLYYGLVTSGEEVVDLYLLSWHKYRGVERRLAGLTPADALFLVERAEGLSAVSSAVAFARAVESAGDVPVSTPVVRQRSLYVELERLYNHAQCVVALCQSTGLQVGQSQAEIALELLLRLNAAVCGHRYLFGVVEVCGTGRLPDLAALEYLLVPARDELCRVLDGLLDTNSFLDRLEATGIVRPDEAAGLGLVGPIGRASGSTADVRSDHPVDGAVRPLPAPASRSSGDVMARLLVRRAEIDESARLIAAVAAAGAGAGRPSGPAPPFEAGGSGLGWCESPRGETLAWVELDAERRLARVRLRTASARNWRAFDNAVRAQNVFTDVPIIEASFWLTAAGRVL